MATHKNERPEEQPAVRTTIVGGRPPGAGQGVGAIPRGIEVLVKKAAVDEAFRERLLAERAGAAAEIGLELAPSEVALLAAIPADHLAGIIARTLVSPRTRPAFLGKAAALMLAALGAGSGCPEPVCQGARPDMPPEPIVQTPTPTPTPDAPGPSPPPDYPVNAGIGVSRPEPAEPEVPPLERPDEVPVDTGIRADRPDATEREVPPPRRPDTPPPPTGIRPDRSGG